jgi:chromosome segregation ATPase
MAVSNKPSGNGQQTIEQLQERYNKLHEQKIQAKTRLDSARERLEGLQKDAREKYGTDDLAELQAKLDAMQAENERKRAAYQADLDRIEKDLDAVQRRFEAAANAPAENAP